MRNIIFLAVVAVSALSAPLPSQAGGFGARSAVTCGANSYFSHATHGCADYTADEIQSNARNQADCRHVRMIWDGEDCISVRRPTQQFDTPIDSPGFFMPGPPTVTVLK